MNASPSPVAEPVIELVLRHGLPDTLQYVVGIAEGPAGRIAAVNVKEGAGIPATAPWIGSGALFAEQADGTWVPIDTGGTFEQVRFGNLFDHGPGPMVIHGGVTDDPQHREVSGLWTSEDGRTWTEESPEPGRGPVAQGPLGYVQAFTTSTGTAPGALEIYTSPDARTWNLVHTEPMAAGSDVREVDVGAEGYVVLVQRSDTAPPQVILASADGVTWHHAPEQSSIAGDDDVLTVSPIGPNWVAAGWSAPNEIALWWSANALDWERTGGITSDVEPFGYPGHLFEVRDRLFLSASLATEGTETRPAGIWTSVDGRTWDPLDLGPEAEVRAGLATDCCLILGGRIGTEGAEAAIWVWRTGE